MNLEAIKDTIQRLGLHTKASDTPLITKRGGSYAWLFDLRRVFMDPDALMAIAQEFWRRNATHPPFQLAGLETAAIPLLTALMLTAPKERGPVNGFIVRKDRKTTGLGRSIEGEVMNLPVMLVDDSLNSGTSAEKARSIISSAGFDLHEMFVVIDFRSRAGMQWRQQHDISVDTLFTLEDFDLEIEHTPPPLTQGYRELWRTVTPGGFAFHVVPKSAPLLVGNRIYRGSDCGRMQAFSTDSGGTIWDYHATGTENSKKGIWSCPAYHDGRIYFGAYNGSIYCLNADTGQEVWCHSDGEWVGASPLIIPEHNLLCIGVEYVRPWAQGSLGAYDLDTGHKRWEHQVGKLQHGSPGYWKGGDLVIWGSADHETLALDAKTGAVVWRFPTRRSVKYAPAVDETRRLTAFASFDKSIYVLDVATGKKLGEWQTGEICYTTPLFVDNKLFCGSGDRYLYVIDIDRMELIKRIYLHARVYASPRLINGRVVVATNGGQVVEVDKDSLEIVGRLQLPDAVTNAVAHSEDGRRLYVSTYMNHLYAFERLSTNTTETSPERISVEKTASTDSIESKPPILARQESRHQNFEMVMQDIDVRGIRAELEDRPELWLASTTRQDQVAVQRETESIFLRSADRERQENRPLEDVHESRATSLARNYPATVAWADAFAKREGKRVARMLFAKLKPKGQVYPHVDGGEYYLARDRYHLILSSSDGSKMVCGDEEVLMREGELWWFDNKQMHAALNPSHNDRVHLIFDLESIP